jgi:hypothetical protein
MQLATVYRLRVRGLDRKRRKRFPNLRYTTHVEQVQPQNRVYAGLQLLRVARLFYAENTFHEKLFLLISETILAEQVSPVRLIRQKQQRLTLGRLLFFKRG